MAAITDFWNLIKFRTTMEVYEERKKLCPKIKYFYLFICLFCLIHKFRRQMYEKENLFAWIRKKIVLHECGNNAETC